MRRALLLWTIITSIACSAVAVALAQDDDTEVDEGTPAPQPAQAISPQDRARRAKVIARVGEARITVGDVEDAINQQSPFLRVRYRDPEQLRSFVEGMVRFELLARAADRAHMGDDPEVERTVKQTAVQQLIRRDFDEHLTPERVPEADVHAYYDAHPDEFNREELRRAAHISVASRAEAERLLPGARDADARAFRELAQEHSLDAETRLRGGDLRYFDARGRSRNERDPQVNAALAAAAFRLGEVGDVAPEPIQIGERWSVVKLTGRRPAEHHSFEESAQSIRLRLWRERRQGGLEDFVARLRRQARVQPHYDRLRPIRLDPPAREDQEEEAARPGRPPRVPARAVLPRPVSPRPEGASAPPANE